MKFSAFYYSLPVWFFIFDGIYGSSPNLPNGEEDSIEIKLEKACKELGLGPDCNTNMNSVKKSYRKLSLQFHPDKNPGNPDAEEQFKKISGAFKFIESYNSRPVIQVSKEGLAEILKNENFDALTVFGGIAYYSSAQFDAYLSQVIDFGKQKKNQDYLIHFLGQTPAPVATVLKTRLNRHGSDPDVFFALANNANKTDEDSMRVLAKMLFLKDEKYWKRLIGGKFLWRLLGHALLEKNKIFINFLLDNAGSYEKADDLFPHLLKDLINAGMVKEYERVLGLMKSLDCIDSKYLIALIWTDKREFFKITVGHPNLSLASLSKTTVAWFNGDRVSLSYYIARGKVWAVKAWLDSHLVGDDEGKEMLSAASDDFVRSIILNHAKGKGASRQSSVKNLNFNHDQSSAPFCQPSSLAILFLIIFPFI